MKRLFVTLIALFNLSVAFAENPAYEALESIMDSMDSHNPTVATLNTGLLTSLGPVLTVGSVVTGATNVLLGDGAAKMSIIEKAAPSAMDFIENKIISEEFLAAAIMLIDEKMAMNGVETVNEMIERKEINLEALAFEIINR